MRQEEQESGQKLTACPRTHNACCAQDKVNQDIEKVMEQEMEEWVQNERSHH